MGGGAVRHNDSFTVLKRSAKISKDAAKKPVDSAKFPGDFPKTPKESIRFPKDSRRFRNSDMPRFAHVVEATSRHRDMPIAAAIPRRVRQTQPSLAPPIA